MHFKDFHKSSKYLLFNKVPFSQISQLKFTHRHAELEYKLSQADSEFCTVNVRSLNSTRQEAQSTSPIYPNVQISLKMTLSKEKEAHLMYMMRWMLAFDRKYSEVVLKK